MLCLLTLYMSGGIYSLKSTPNDWFLEKLFMAILFTLRVFAKNLLRGNRRRNIFSYFVLISNLGFWTEAFRLISQQADIYQDFKPKEIRREHWQTGDQAKREKPSKLFLHSIFCFLCKYALVLCRLRTLDQSFFNDLRD